MKTVKVNKSALLSAVSENRDGHRKIFEEAVAGYKAEATRLLEGHLARIKDGKLVAVFVQLPVPLDHTRDYDRVLRMVNMSVDPEIELTEQDFAQYVMDDWMWKREFLNTAVTYNSPTANAALEVEE
jgi:hypothetical protein